METKKIVGLAVAGAAIGLAAWIAFRRFTKQHKYVEDDVISDVLEKQVVPPLSPRSVKLVLDETKEQTVSEEQSEEFQLISPRLESFLNEPAQKKIPAARGPNAAARKIKTPVSKTTSAKKPVKMTASELEEDDDDDLPLDDEEIKAILARGRKKVAAEEAASQSAPFAIVSPRLEKFLEDK